MVANGRWQDQERRMLQGFHDQVVSYGLIKDQTLPNGVCLAAVTVAFAESKRAKIAVSQIEG
jgi:hypothetical protein